MSQAQDERLFGLLSQHAADGGLPFRSFREAACKLGIPRKFLSKGPSFMPKSSVLLEQLVLSKRKLEKAA